MQGFVNCSLMLVHIIIIIIICYNCRTHMGEYITIKRQLVIRNYVLQNKTKTT